MEVCNSCGGTQDIRSCRYCVIVAVCAKCILNHEVVCERVQKRKALGLGPTVRPRD